MIAERKALYALLDTMDRVNESGTDDQRKTVDAQLDVIEKNIKRIKNAQRNSRLVNIITK